MAPGYRLSLPLRHTVISITSPPQARERGGGGAGKGGHIESQLRSKEMFLQRAAETLHIFLPSKLGRWANGAAGGGGVVCVTYSLLLSLTGFFIIWPGRVSKSRQHHSPHHLLLMWVREQNAQHLHAQHVFELLSVQLWSVYKLHVV